MLKKRFLAKLALLSIVCLLTTLFISTAVHAMVAVKSFCDFTQERCKDLDKNLDLLKEKYKYDILVEKYYYDHSWSEEIVLPLLAVECVKEQGNSVENYRKLLYKNLGKVSRENLKQYASAISLNAANFSFCLDVRLYEKNVKEALEYPETQQITTVPSFRIKDDIYEGISSFTAVEDIIKFHIGLTDSIDNGKLEQEQAEWRAEQARKDAEQQQFLADAALYEEQMQDEEETREKEKETAQQTETPTTITIISEPEQPQQAVEEQVSDSFFVRLWSKITGLFKR